MRKSGCHLPRMSCWLPPDRTAFRKRGHKGGLRCLVCGHLLETFDGSRSGHPPRRPAREDVQPRLSFGFSFFCHRTLARLMQASICWGFESLAMEIPTPPSDHTPLRRCCAFLRGLRRLKVKYSRAVAVGFTAKRKIWECLEMGPLKKRTFGTRVPRVIHKPPHAGRSLPAPHFYLELLRQDDPARCWISSHRVQKQMLGGYG